MITIEECENQILEQFNYMEKLELLILDRNAEILLYKAFIKEKGFEEEFNKLLRQAKLL